VLIYPARAAAAARSTVAGEGSVTGEIPFLDALADITAASVEHHSLAPREFMLVRMAALIEVNAPSASYLRQCRRGRGQRVTADDTQAVMIAGAAPVVGRERVVSAGGNIPRALGMTIAVADSKLAGDGDAGP
jgi:hypothetical protein